MTTFTKMHGLGNDFVVFDATRGRLDLSQEKIRRLADRRFGVGCDQVLVVEPPARDDVDFRFRFYNSNGSEAQQCGNGVRCLLRFARDKSLTGKTEIAAETLAGVIRLRLEPDGQVSVDMGVPRFEPAAVPFEAPAREQTYRLAVDGQDLDVSVLSMGNPHAVQIVPDVERAPVATQGPLIEGHARFPERVNVGYLQVVDRSHARLRVYERGAGETLACGSGACAAMVAGRQRGLLDDKVDMALRGGSLRIAWKGEGEPVRMTGPATVVFEGSIDLDRL